MTEYERKREEIAKMIWYWNHTVISWEMAWDWGKDAHRERADQILSLDGIEIRADDQSLPDNLAWHKEDREFEAYCAGHNDMLGVGFVKVIPKNSPQKTGTFRQ